MNGRALSTRQREFERMLIKTPIMHHVFEIIRLVAPTEATVVIEGETGTEKEAVASAIHSQSPRQQGPFVTISCDALPEAQIETELFGYEEGVFTGTRQSRQGKIELANGGTLFLDDIESLSVIMQAKLLRVLEEQKIQLPGGGHVDVRVIIGTRIPLKKLVAEGRMRSDFYYRMNVISIPLVPLRQRKSDIPLLVQGFLHRSHLAVEKGVTQVSAHAIDRLRQYHWPGNIRELQSVLEKAVVLATSSIVEKVDVPDASAPKEHEESAPVLPLSEWIKEQEKQYLIQKLHTFGGNIELTAKSCRVGTRTLYRKMRLYGLNKKTFRPKASEGFLSLRKRNGLDHPSVKK
jgi:DNA-binding NtrC family response regulator